MKLYLAIAIVLSTCTIQAQTLNFDIPHYTWAEDVSSNQIEAFIERKNSQTETLLQKNPDFEKIQSYFKKRILLGQEIAKTKAHIRKNFAYNFLTDDTHPNGLYRRTDKSSYLKAKESNDFSKLQWENILDLDAAIKTIKFPREVTDPAAGNWRCFYDENIKENTRCLISFSQSGGDRNVVYEFDSQKKQWVTETPFNFEILGRNRFSWIDENTLVVSLDGLTYYNATHPNAPITREQAINMGLLTPSGYPSRFYIWKRGEPFSIKNMIYKADADQISVSFGGKIKLSKDFDPMKIFTLYESTDQRNYVLYLFHDISRSGQYTKTVVPLPKEQDIVALTDNAEIIFKTKQDWKGFKKEDLLSIEFKIQDNNIVFSEPKLIYRLQDPNSVLREFSFSENENYDPKDDQILITLSKNVSERILVLNRSDSSWSRHELNEPMNLKYKSMSAWVDDEDKSFHLKVTSFLVPSTEYIVTNKNGVDSFQQIDKSLSAFDESKFVVEQLWIDQGLDQNGKAIKVPYYIVYDPKKITLTENKNPAPTLIYGYGGFSIGLMPSYLGSRGHLWLEKGGVYVLANIRGGDEFGSYWHESALKQNRSNSYNDFIGIAEDLIKRGITSPDKLSIEGGSNGGLLVGVAMTQRPDLYKAVLCEVPLLDMSRYHKLSMGSSWMSEYGNPDTTEKEFWKRYSPLHQLKKDVIYPTVFIKTNRNDDRVHPAHARKFALRLEELGINHLLYEDLKGGHGGTSMTSDESAFRATLDYSFLYEQLGMKY